jgi:hypothetical protein
MGTGYFQGVKRPGHGVDHPPPSCAEVKERVELYLYSSSGPSWPLLGLTLPLPLPSIRTVRIAVAFCPDVKYCYLRTERCDFREIVAQHHPVNTVMLVVAAVKTTNLALKI